MLLKINISKEMEPVLLEAVKLRFSYSETVKNPKSQPEPILNKKGVVTNQKKIDAWPSQVPNPVSPEEFLREMVVKQLRTWIGEYQAGAVLTKASEDTSSIS